MTSILEISARGSLILWARFHKPVCPRSGREEEKCQTLDHIRQIPYFHQAPFMRFTTVNFNIYTKLFRLLFSIWYIHRVLENRSFVINACALPEPPITRFQRNFEFILSLRGTSWYEIQRDIAIINSTCTQLHRNIGYRSQRVNYANWQLQNGLRNWK